MTELLPVNTSPPEFSPAPITDEEAAAMFRTALNLFRFWGITDDEAAEALDGSTERHVRRLPVHGR